MATPVYYLIAGEASGDFLGSWLMRALRAERQGAVRFRGVGGPLMQAEGLELLFPHTELMHFGLAEVLRHIPRLLRRIREAARDVVATRPDALITIDAPDFNFRVAKRVRKASKHSIPIIHYVAPTVWAWRPGRAKKIARFLDHLLAVLPFEPPYFTREGLDCTFVGHSVVEGSANHGSNAIFRVTHGIGPDTPLLAILPGSRMSEVSRLLPIFRDTVLLLRVRHPDLQIVVPVVPHLMEYIVDEISTWGLPAHVAIGERDKYHVMATARAAIACSGTVSLELALARLPTVIAYKVNALTAWIARRVLRVRYVTLVNIMQNAEVMPEFLQEDCTPEKLAQAVDRLLSDETLRHAQIEKLQTVGAWLGQNTFVPSQRAAQAVLAAIKKFHAPTVMQVLPALVTGGVERGTVEITAALVQNGFNALVTSAGGPMVEEILAAGGTHITLPLKSKNPFTIWRNVSRLACVIRERKAQIVHARSRAPAWSAYKAARRTGATFLTTFHAPYSAGNKLKKFYNSVMAKGARVIAISNFVASYAARTYHVPPEKIRVIPRGVDIEIFDRAHISADRIDALREAWSLTKNVPVILMPGRLTRWKGQLVLLEALARLKAHEYVCIIVGGGRDSRYGNEVAQEIKQFGLRHRVRIYDTCRDMPAAYALADIVISASTRPEGFGRVVIEAQAMGCAVIASNHGGAAETVIDGETGFLTPPGDAERLAQVLRKVLDRPVEEREIFAAQATAHIRAHFTTASMQAKTLAVYRELLEERDEQSFEP
ncbi:MAG: lipid-A-disaccharide synthase [Alphaproteobacteria bacterium]|nr:lipid-A-disaccharide synthase [Alphaproteobacteria bacterium]